jgi:hypothetical protein
LDEISRQLAELRAETLAGRVTAGLALDYAISTSRDPQHTIDALHHAARNEMAAVIPSPAD